MTNTKSYEDRIRNAKEASILFNAMNTFSLNRRFSEINQESARLIINGFVKDCCDTFLIDLSTLDSAADRLRERKVRAIEMSSLLQIMSNYNYIDECFQELAKGAVSIFAGYVSDNSFPIAMFFVEGSDISIDDIRQLEMECLIKIMERPNLIDGEMQESVITAIQSYFDNAASKVVDDSLKK